MGGALSITRILIATTSTANLLHLLALFLLEVLLLNFLELPRESVNLVLGHKKLGEAPSRSKSCP